MFIETLFCICILQRYSQKVVFTNKLRFMWYSSNKTDPMLKIYGYCYLTKFMKIHAMTKSFQYRITLSRILMHSFHTSKQKYCSLFGLDAIQKQIITHWGNKSTANSLQIEKTEKIRNVIILWKGHIEQNISKSNITTCYWTSNSSFPKILIQMNIRNGLLKVY